VENWVVYELIAGSMVLVRDYDVREYVELLARCPVTEDTGPVYEAHRRGATVRLHVVIDGVSELEARRMCGPAARWAGVTEPV
jgi:hypothetical protein